jgi:hypothetical protein
VYPVDFGGAAGEGQRRADVTAFIQGQLDQQGLDEIMNRWGVDYIVVRETEGANRPLLAYYRVTLDEEVGPYEIYRVAPQ